ncbi:MAG: hypothetical protein LBH66_09195 [Oscillospiraceae bacterium]|nr:hypothetical protein [Oscillospiraceae bacterium]
MTREQARAALCIWAHSALIRKAISDLIEETSGRAQAARDTPVHIHMEETAVMTGRHGDGVGYAADAARRLERQTRYLRALAKGAAGIAGMADECVPGDPGIVRALKARARSGGTWRDIGAACQIKPSAALDGYLAAQRELVKRPWSDRETAVVIFAYKFVKNGELPRALKQTGMRPPLAKAWRG